MQKQWNRDGWSDKDWAHIEFISRELRDVSAELDNRTGGGGGFTPQELQALVKLASSLAARLAGIEPTFGSNPLQPAPLLDFAKASKFKKVKKWMTKVDNIRRQVYANPRPAILASKMMQELGAPLLAIK